jgi:hypothetical protein
MLWGKATECGVYDTGEYTLILFQVVVRLWTPDDSFFVANGDILDFHFVIFTENQSTSTHGTWALKLFTMLHFLEIMVNVSNAQRPYHITSFSRTRVPIG